MHDKYTHTHTHTHTVTERERERERERETDRETDGESLCCLFPFPPRVLGSYGGANEVAKHRYYTKEVSKRERQRERGGKTPGGERENILECVMCNTCMTAPLSQKQHCNERYLVLPYGQTN